MKKLLHLLLLTIMSHIATAQDEREAIRNVIDLFFEAMHQGDSSAMNKTLASQVTLATIVRNKEGKSMLIQQETKEELLAAIGTPHDDVYSEPVWNVVIQADDNLATVWCDYAFYVNKTFHHCGADAFQLFKGEDGWKIFHIADTRRKEGCDVPADVKARFTQ